jgi:hypothetical protein
MVASIDDSGISMDALLMEVLKSETALGKEMRDKVSATLDIATSKIEAGVGAMKFNTSPINITDLTGMSAAETERNGKAFAAQQRKMLKWIKDVTTASNWKQLRKGVTINDIFVSDKVMNDRLEKEYRALQRKILKTIKSNIPTKMDALPKQAAKVMKVAPPKTDPSENKSSFISGILGKMGTNIKKVGKGVNDKIKDIKSEKTIPSNKKITPSKNKSSFISGILGKMGTKKKATGDFNESVKYVNIGEFGKKAVEQLSKALPSKDGKDVKKMGIEKPSAGFLKTLLKVAGITALLGLVTYLAKNPEKWEDAKVFFKERFVPWLKSLPKIFGDLMDKVGKWWEEDAKPMLKRIKKYFSEDFKHDFNGMVAAISAVIKSVGNTIGNFQKVAKGELVNIPDGPWWSVNIIDRFFQIGQGLGLAASYTVDWVASLPAKYDEMTSYIGSGMLLTSEALIKGWDDMTSYIGSKMLAAKEKSSKGWDDMTSYIGSGMLLAAEALDETVFKPLKAFGDDLWKNIKEMGASIKETILKIPDFMKDMFKKIKNQFTESIKGRWGKDARKEREIATVEKNIEKEKSRGIKGSTEKISSWEAKLMELNNGKDSDTADDFIFRPGQPIQKFSGSDVLIGAKEKLIVENKNLDKQMHDLTSVMEAIKGKFDQLISLNMEMVKRGGSNGTRPEPLPPIPTDIGTNRALAYDEALNHKTKVWELLHGV